ncbi:C25 family cysteine peptidase [Bacteroidota bacterium]
MKKYIIILLMIFSNNLFASNIDVTTNRNSVTIQISSLSQSVQTSKLYDYKYLNLKGLKYVVPQLKDAVLTDELRFQISIPDDCDYHLDYEILSTRQVDIYDITFKSSFEYNISFKKIGYQRGVLLGILTVNPFTFDSKTKTISIIESAEITLNFDRDIMPGELRENDPEYPFFSNVVNQQHLSGLLSKSGNEKRYYDRLQNEDWYNPSTTYIKILTKNDGIAMINAGDVLSTENSFSGKPIKYLHLFYKGEEQPIYINNDIDSEFNGGDEIIFIGYRAEGDTTWFNNYTDYSAFFLYYDESSEGLRFSEFPDVSGAQDLDYVNINKHVEYENLYFCGLFDLQWDVENIHREGWYWQEMPSIGSNRFDYSFQILPFDTLNININLASIVWDVSQIFKHNFSILINDQSFSTFSIDIGAVETYNIKVPSNYLLDGSNKISVINLGNLDKDTNLIRVDNIAVNYIEINGKVKPYADNGIAELLIEDIPDNFNLIIPEFNGDHVFLIDKISNSYANVNVMNDFNIGLNGGKNYDLLLYNSSAVEKAKIISVNNSDLRDVNHQADAIFITHAKFKQAADSLANYRRSQGIEVEVINVYDIYKEFNYGIKSPHAIKSFLRYSNNNWRKPAPQFLLLIGDGNWDSRNHLQGSVNIDYIPSYGWPVSDFWYACLDTGKDYLHDMLVGRIPANEQTDVYNVINKIMEYDSVSKRPWMKRFLSLVGGKDHSQTENFKENMDAMLESYWINTELAGDTMCVTRRNWGNNAVDEAEANEIIRKIDNGVVWVNFYGHGATSVFDIDGWHAPKLNNKGKYSFFTTISCNTGAFAEPENTARNETYLTIADKGFIATCGSSNVGLDLPGMMILTNMLNIVSDTSSKQRTIGEILNNAKIPMMNDDFQTISFARQFTLLGDPLTHIRIPADPDLYIISDDVRISNYLDNIILIESDSAVKVQGYIYNNGFCERNEVNLKLIHNYHEEWDTLEVSYNGICRYEEFRFDTLKIFDRLGTHYVSILINTPDTTLLAYQGSFEVFQNGLLALEPLPFWNINGDKLHFRFISPKYVLGQEYEFLITYIDDDVIEKIYYNGKNNEVQIFENYIDWLPDTVLINNSNYYLYGRIVNSDLNISSDWLRVPFYTVRENPDTVKSQIGKVRLGDDFFNNCELQNLELFDDSGKKTLRFDDLEKDYTIISVKGNDTVTRYCEIVYDNVIYVYTAGPYNAPVGINLVVVSGTDGSYVTMKKYNTWDTENSSHDLVTFLNDSINDGDWLLLGSCGGAWRMFYHTGLNNPDAVGGFSSFKKVLRSFGSLLVDEIPESGDSPKISFAFAGRKGSQPGTANESIIFDGSRVILDDNLKIKSKTAFLRTPQIGVAKEWMNFDIDADIPVSDVSTTLSVFGIVNDYEEELIKDYINILKVDLSEKDFIDFSKIRTKLEIERFTDDIDLSIRNINFEFIPAPELAISKKGTWVIQDSILRGDTADVKYMIENISLRTTADTSKVHTIISNSAGAEKRDTIFINSIRRDDSTEYIQRVVTTYLDYKNVIKLSVNFENSIVETYSFNNNLQINLDLIRDTIKPWIRVWIDTVEILNDSLYVSLRPFIEIEMMDNSLVPVSEEPIKVRINSLTQNFNNSDDYLLVLINQDSLKARLSFLPDTLFDFENSLEVFVEDASGNKDTVKYHLFTSINSFIIEPNNYPNPFEYNTSLRFNYIAPDNSGHVSVNIFDMRGKKIRSINSNLVIGANEISWNGLDDYGNSIPSGVYFYILNVISENYSEPGKGHLLKVR